MPRTEKPLPPIQKKVRALYEDNGWKTDRTLLLVLMQEKLGKLSARCLTEQHPGHEKPTTDTDPVSEGVGDLLQVILAFCNARGINFEDSVKSAIGKKKKKQKK
jgi:hypothetical protein